MREAATMRRDRAINTVGGEVTGSAFGITVNMADYVGSSWSDRHVHNVSIAFEVRYNGVLLREVEARAAFGRSRAARSELRRARDRDGVEGRGWTLFNVDATGSRVTVRLDRWTASAAPRFATLRAAAEWLADNAEPRVTIGGE
jgi:hypothetical protein